MDVSHLRSLNLNLLVALHLLLEERSVSRAALRLGVSQPSMSVSLKSLRAHFDDPLLVRRGRGMGATELANALAPMVAGAVAATSEVFIGATNFVPATAKRRFSIVLSEDESLLFLPAVLRRLRSEAPNIQLRVERYANFTAERLLSGDVDFWFLKQNTAAEDFPTEILIEDYLVVVGCVRRHADTVIRSPEDFRKYPILAENQPSGAYPRSFRLPRYGDPPAIHTVVPTRVELLFCLAGTDFIAAVARRLFLLLGEQAGIRILTEGLGIQFPYIMQWHPSRDTDLGHRWLRTMIRDTVRELG